MRNENKYLISYFLKKKIKKKIPKIIKFQNNYQCNITAKKNSNYKCFGLTRLCLKQLINNNYISGFKIAKW